MGAKSKSGKNRSAKHSQTANAPARRGRGKAVETWEQAAQVTDQRYDKIDCQRIIRGAGGRCLPLYCDYD